MSTGQALNRTFKTALIEWAESVGIRLRTVPHANSLAAAFGPDAVAGNLTGVRDWTLVARAQRERLDALTVVHEAERAREDNGTAYAAAILQQRRPNGSAPGAIEPIVVLSLPTWARIIAALEGRDD